MNDTWQGILLWTLLFFPVWFPGCRRVRKQIRRGVSGNLNVKRVSLSELADKVDADLDTWGVGPDWVQDKPYPELFDDKEEPWQSKDPKQN